MVHAPVSACLLYVLNVFFLTRKSGYDTLLSLSEVVSNLVRMRTWPLNEVLTNLVDMVL